MYFTTDEEKIEVTAVCPVSRIRTDVVRRLNGKGIQRMNSPDETQLYCPVKRIEEIHKPVTPVYNTFHHISFVDMVKGYRSIIADPSCEWISDFMFGEEWNPGEYVFLEAGCSTGKNTYAEMLKDSKRYNKILILANRRANRMQILERLGINEDSPFRHVEVRTYQGLEMDSGCWSRDLEWYDLIIADECHYFVKDAQFNARANISLEKIMGTKWPIKLFMSATLSEVQLHVMSLLRRKYADNQLPSICSYYKMMKSKQHIEGVSYVDVSEIIYMMKSSSEKWLVFVDTKELGKMLADTLGENAVFVSAESSTSDTKAASAYKQIVETESFEQQYLIATSVLDNGINLKDKRLRHVVISSNDRIESIQMLGRKRCIDPKDSFKLYILHSEPAEIAKALGINRIEQKEWIKTRLHLENEVFPPLEFSLNSEPGEASRERIYMHEQKQEFCFNRLGLISLRIAEADLVELDDSTDIFWTKLNWLFAGIQVPPILSGTMELRNRRINKVMCAISEYVGQSYQAKDSAFEKFKTLFSEIYWNVFGLDSEALQRSDRSLSPSKINDCCEKQGIPIRLEKAIKRKKTIYTIQHIMACLQVAESYEGRGDNDTGFEN